ncbi:MAG: hypothetical protein LBK41_02360 [Clostridiales bacterium]|jgi:NRPS condensation-like uncharacterized protein|nr:hypothetical protein [Clostridiales bacterium]
MDLKAEAFDIWMYLQNITNYNPLIRCRIDFDGRLDADVLRESVTVSIRAVPVLGCVFDGVRLYPRWADKGFDGGDMVRTIIADAGAERTVFQIMSDGVEVTREPPLKISVVRKTSGDTMCAVISHLICDGMGFKAYLYLLSNCYTKLARHEEFSVPKPGCRGTKPLLRSVRFGERLRILRSRFDAYASSNRQEGLSRPASDQNETYMENLVIAAEDFGRLRRSAKADGATVNDALMALYARAFCKETRTEKVLLPSTMDLRRFLPPGNIGFSNYVGNCMCAVTVRGGDSLSETMKQVSARMGEHKSGKNVLKQVMLWDAAVRFLPLPVLKPCFRKFVAEPVISYTNLGVLEKERLCFASAPVKRAYMTASIKPRPYLQLTASTWDGYCTICCNIYGCESDRAFVRRLLDDIAVEIKSIIA